METPTERIVSQLGDIVAKLDKLGEQLTALAVRVDELAAQLQRVDSNSQRNRVVAEKYGDRADSLFSVVDSVGSVMNHMNPLTYINPARALITTGLSGIDSDSD